MSGEYRGMYRSALAAQSAGYLRHVLGAYAHLLELRVGSAGMKGGNNHLYHLDLPAFELLIARGQK